VNDVALFRGAITLPSDPLQGVSPFAVPAHQTQNQFPNMMRHIRLNILKANGVPTIDEFRVLPPSRENK
jgi:hypothetical protein